MVLSSPFPVWFLHSTLLALKVAKLKVVGIKSCENFAANFATFSSATFSFSVVRNPLGLLGLKTASKWQKSHFLTCNSQLLIPATFTPFFRPEKFATSQLLVPATFSAFKVIT